MSEAENDHRCAVLLLADEGFPPEWLVEDGYLVPIRPWWCFWKARKIHVRLSPETRAIRKTTSIPRAEARRQLAASGKHRRYGALLSWYWF